MLTFLIDLLNFPTDYTNTEMLKHQKETVNALPHVYKEVQHIGSSETITMYIYIYGGQSRWGS